MGSGGADERKEKRKGKRADKGVEKKGLPQRLEDQHNYVTCGGDLNFHTSVPRSANVYWPIGVDNAWDFAEFASKFRIDVTKLTDAEVQFDMVGVDPSIANALRRIMIAEVPTMAIEHVFIVNNTSIMPDEMLAHRLGMVPLRANARAFEVKASGEAPNEKNTLAFKLHVQCSWGRDGKMENERVTSGLLQWLPSGSEMPEETGVRFASSQGDRFQGGAAPRPTHDDISLMRLRPGQQIQLEAHATKGIGREHAKWSPVATAWYRLQPEVRLLRPVRGAAADALAAELPGLAAVAGSGEGREAVLGEAREHDQLLEKVRRLSAEDEWRDILQLRKRKEHLMVTAQSSGALPPCDIMREAIKVLADKCDTLLARL